MGNQDFYFIRYNLFNDYYNATLKSAYLYT